MDHSLTQSTSLISSDRSPRHLAIWRSVWVVVSAVSLAYAGIQHLAPILELPPVSPWLYVAFGVAASLVMAIQAQFGNYSAEQLEVLSHGQWRDVVQAARIRHLIQLRMTAGLLPLITALAAELSPSIWVPAATLTTMTFWRELAWYIERPR